MASPNDSQDFSAPRTLATAGLPRRVRRILERTLALYSEELERNLVATMGEFEEELFRLAERSGTTGGGSMFDHMQTLRVVRLNRHDLVPRFMLALESGLASIRTPQHLMPVRTVVPSATPLNFRNLSLVDESVMDEGAVLHAIASRQESRTNLTLHLLGQRFGVLGAMPAFDSERNPVGPQALCRAIRHAGEVLQLEHDARLLFYRTFDRRVMVHCQALFEKLDALLIDEGVLPGLSYVPMRTRAASAATDEPSPGAGQSADPARFRNAEARMEGDAPGGMSGTPGGDVSALGGAVGGLRGSGPGAAGGRATGATGGAFGSGGGGGRGGNGDPATGGTDQGGAAGGAGASGQGAGHAGHDAGGTSGYPGQAGQGHGAQGHGMQGHAGRGSAGQGSAAQGRSVQGHAGQGPGSHGAGGGLVGPWGEEPADPATAFGEDASHEHGAHDPHRPHTAWIGQPMGAVPVDEQKAFNELQKLLTQRRAEQERVNPVPPGQRSEQPLPMADLLQGLGRLDTDAAAGGASMSIADVKHSLLAQARQRYGKPVALSPADNDTFDLLGLLYSHLQQEMRPDAPAAALIKRLQISLLRVALQDRAFFVRPNHPARQLLSNVSDTAAKWLADDDFDPALLKPLQESVTHAVKHYDGAKLDAFEQGNKQLQAHIEAQVRRAESLERRHVEAARGKEKLEAAKLRVEQTLAAEIGERPLPKFSRALLNQAWADVLTLTCLRHGEGSEEWNRQLDATRQIVDACDGQAPAGENAALKTHVEAALKQVGYHDEEADAIAQRLSSSVREDEDGESRTELTMKLRARVRLGEDAQKTRKPDLPPRTPHEEACHEQLRLLPFGTWIEFVTNQQGDVVRRRMSWHSSVTGNALFVNQRGQRVGEHSLDSLARMMARDQIRVVTAQRARLLDRAWHAALSALRSLAGRRDEDADHDDIAVRSVPAAPLDEAGHDAGHDDTAIRSTPASRDPAA